jgi:DNA helicase-2/ATP-dependent DNA helicase PcrA
MPAAASSSPARSAAPLTPLQRCAALVAPSRSALLLRRAPRPLLPRRVGGGGAGVQPYVSRVSSAAGGGGLLPAPPPPPYDESAARHLVGLNAEQRSVVLSAPAALRVLAAPGSGKTRVLTCRVAHLIACGVRPERILCITFTRKAAREMAERLESLLGTAGRGVQTGTFHSVASRLLRAHIQEVPNARQTEAFTIYDSEDSESLMRNTLRELGLYGTPEDKKANKPGVYQSYVSRAKSALPRAYAATGGEAFDALVRAGVMRPKGDTRERVFKPAYDAYTAALARSNALDFDDIVSFAVEAMSSSPTLAGRLAARWPHVLVDEFQDTNQTQYEFVRSLGSQRGGGSGGGVDGAAAPPAAASASAPVPSWRSLLVVGDSDQSIYGWRGAQIDLMRVRFTNDTGARSAPLAANYRSTPQICAAAEAVLAGSATRSELRVAPVRGTGPPVALWTAADGAAEAYMVADEIARLLATGGGEATPVRGADIAVLYRTHWQSRAIEGALLRRNIRYMVLGGVPFFARREIKDLTAYLRLIYNPRDDVAFRRIVNVPARGISDATLEKLGDWVQTLPLAAPAKPGGKPAALSLSAALLADVGVHPLPPMASCAETGLKPKAAASVVAFRTWLASWVRIAQTATVPALLRRVIDDTKYKQYVLDDEKEGDEEARWNNVLELLSLAATPQEEEELADAGAAPLFDTPAPLPTGMPALGRFLEDAALMSATDMASKDEPDAVRLMTMHGAKGLEFEAVFAVGLEDGIIPSDRAVNEALGAQHAAAAMEEERRLMYVAVTRAKRRLYLCRAEARKMYGGGEASESEESPFLTAVVKALGKDKAMTAKRYVEGRQQGGRRPDAPLAMQAPRLRGEWGMQDGGATEEEEEGDADDERGRERAEAAGAWSSTRNRARAEVPVRRTAAAAGGARRALASSAAPPLPPAMRGLRGPLPPAAPPKPPPAVAAAARAAAVSDAAEMAAAREARAAAAKARRGGPRRPAADGLGPPVF